MNAIRVFAFGMFVGLPLAAQERADEDFKKLFSSILPKEEELAWQKIAWRSTLGQSVAEAREEDKPILLWAMNGHPLACT
jgi:hypothetical protein